MEEVERSSNETVTPPSLARSHQGQLQALRRRRSCWANLTSPVQDGSDPDLLLEIELLTLSFATGIQDATTFPDYQCFASNQTGNTVLFAVGAAGLANGAFTLENVGVSLGVFVGSCIIMGQLGNFVGPRRRLWLIGTNVFSTALIFAAAAIQWIYPVERSGTAALVVIALLAFGSGAQVAMARPLNVPQITTVSSKTPKRNSLVTEWN
jgi:hypothetical protein